MNRENTSFYTRGTFFAALSLVVIIFFVFFPSLDNQFVNWDDDIHVTQNHFIQPLSFKTIQGIFLSEVNKTYIPLTVLSFAVERHFFGLDPFMYHVHNLLLHSAVVMLIFWLGRIFGLSVFAAWLAALIFGIHPMHVESVAWVTERKDVLYAVFYLLAMVTYSRFFVRRLLDRGQKDVSLLSREGLFPLTCVVALGLLSVLSKPMALSLPFILLLLDWKMGRKMSPVVLWEKFLIGAVLVPAVLVTFSANLRAVTFVWPDSILIWLWCLGFYIRKFFWPDVFTVFYFAPRHLSVTTPAVAGSLFSALAMVASLWYFRKNRWFGFAVCYFMFSVFFLLRFDLGRDIQVVADRFMYLPSMGICLWLGWLVQKYWPALSRGKRVVSWFLFAGVLLILVWKTYHQCLVWRNGVSLWTHQMQAESRAAMPIIYLKLAEAMVQERAFEAEAAKYRGGVYKTVEESSYLRKVRGLYQKALVLKPEYLHGHRLLAEFYLDLGEPSLAEPHIQAGIRINPDLWNKISVN